jgi:transcription elongation GreA/GreB family factor
MRQSAIERKLKKLSKELAAAQQQLDEVREQYVTFADDESDTALRAAIGEAGASGHHREAAGHAAAMRRQQARLVDRIADIQQRQDALLDGWTRARR